MKPGIGWDCRSFITSIDELPERTRRKLEDEYLVACRKVGVLLDEGISRSVDVSPSGRRQDDGRRGWPITPEDDTLEEMIEVALHEGVRPRGFQLVLENYGTCNAITTFEGTIPNQGRQPGPPRRCS